MLVRLRILIAGLLLLAALSSAGCTYMARETLPPRVQLLDLQLQAVQLFEQRYLMTVRLQNPNDFDLDIRGFDFNIELNGKPFAQGVSDKAVSVPSFADATTEISLSSSILTLMNQLNENGDEVKYRIFGHVKLKGVPIPVSFESKGDLKSLANES